MEHLRRLPWNDEGRDAYTPQGDGIVNAIANAMEASMIETAKEDSRRAQALVADSAASRAEFRLAVGYLARAVEDAVHVAELRLERLDALAGDPPTGAVLWAGEARQIGEAL
ncbi:hypothetical protein ACWCOW_17480 [Streptomyces sp. NPDC001939]